MGAAETSALIMPQNRRCPDLAVRAGDHVTTIDGERLGRVGHVSRGYFEVLSPTGDFWLSREHVFLADEKGVVVAFGLEDLYNHRLDHPVDTGPATEVA